MITHNKGSSTVVLLPLLLLESLPIPRYGMLNDYRPIWSLGYITNQMLGLIPYRSLVYFFFGRRRAQPSSLKSGSSPRKRIESGFISDRQSFISS